MSIVDINFCETDTATVEQSVITVYQQLAGVVLYPGDPVRLFLESLAAIVSQQRQIIDQTGKNNLVRYAAGAFLDHIGAMTDTPRLDPTKAGAQIRFSLSTPLAFIVDIPKGTRATPDGKLFFETMEAAQIPAGNTFLDLACECTTAEAGGNGFLPGQIDKLVDPLPYIATVENTTATVGGADQEADEPYRERIILAPEKYSVAGPDGAYQFWAKTAHQDIMDISVSSPSPGVVDVVPLAVGGTVPGQALMDAVEALLNERDKRPLTDLVQILAPAPVGYNVSFTYYISTIDMPLAAQIQDSIHTAVDDYLLWQRSKLGRDINPSELTRRVMDAGAKRVEITAPVFTALESAQVANENLVTITNGGAENE